MLGEKRFRPAQRENLHVHGVMEATCKRERRWRPVGGLARQAAENRVRDVARYLGYFDGRYRAPGLMKRDQVAGVPREWQLPAHERVRHDGQTIDIRTIIGLPSQRLFRRHE